MSIMIEVLNASSKYRRVLRLYRQLMNSNHCPPIEIGIIQHVDLIGFKEQVYEIILHKKDSTHHTGK